MLLSVPPHRGTAPPLGIAGWILFDFAAQPVFTLVTTFIFAPFFATRLAADPAQGQALWGFATGLAGLTIALLSPLLGAIADAGGRRKPWIAAFSLPLVIGCLLLWLAVPGAPAAVPIALIGFVLMTIGAEFATVFNNSMMAGLVPPDRLGRLSGTGWAAGYVGGLIALALTLAFMVADPQSGRTLAGLAPVFGLDPATGEGPRLSGPFSAVWYLVFVIPLFLFTPDAPRGLPAGEAMRSGYGALCRTISGLSRHRNAATYLLAHMIYADGLVALFAFGGIYGAGVFGWTEVELGVFGILITVTGVVGAWIGGRLDDRFGPKPIVMGALVTLMAAALGILSVTGDRVGFIIPVAPPVAGDGLFATTGELVYLGLGLVIGAVAGPLQAASRTLLVQVAPPGQLTEFFGLYALAGKLTSFACPMLVGAVTWFAADQRVGMSVLMVFFAVGALLLTRVNTVRIPTR